MKADNYPETIVLRGKTYKAKLTPTRIVILVRAADPGSENHNLRTPLEITYNNKAPGWRCGTLALHGRFPYELVDEQWGQDTPESKAKPGKLPRVLKLVHAEHASPALAERIRDVWAKDAVDREADKNAFLRQEADRARATTVRDAAEALLKAAEGSNELAIIEAARTYRDAVATKLEDYLR